MEHPKVLLWFVITKQTLKTSLNFTEKDNIKTAGLTRIYSKIWPILIFQRIIQNTIQQ